MDFFESSRHRIKLFDGDKGKMEDIMESVNKVIELHFERFVNIHTGFWAPLKKMIQSDLGLYYYDNHLISNTHITFFNLGFSDKESVFIEYLTRSLSDLAQSLGYEIGEYMSLMYQLFSLSDNFEPQNFCQYNIDVSILKSRDIKSQYYYANIFNGSATVHLNACLDFLWLRSIL